MKLSKFKQHLEEVSVVNFMQPDGTFIPSHFHITEAGLITKHFIDCGGSIGNDKILSFQLWISTDYHHRIVPKKLLKIIMVSERFLGNEDLDIEMEYQTETIGKYDLDFNGENFLLVPKHTDCRAKDNCHVAPDVQGYQSDKEKISTSACCTPGGGCC